MSEAEPSGPSEVPKFTRSLSGLGVIILTLSVLSPGVSVLVSGGAILTESGTGTILAFVLGGLVCYCQTSMAAELGAAYPTAGYDYAAIGHAIGDWAGATMYLASISSIPLFLSTSAVGIAIYLQPFGVPLTPNEITFVVVIVITVLSLLNMRSNEAITGVFMLIEGAALLLIAAVGIFHVQPGTLHLMTHPMRVQNGTWVVAGIAITGIAINNASWALAGSSQALMFSEDMKRPETISKIIMLAFAITVVLETAPVLGLIVGSHDLKSVLTNDSPFETFLGQYLPGFFLKVVSLSIAIAIFNACLAGFVGIGRNVFAMARTRLFAPTINRSLMTLIPQTDAPWLAIVLIGLSTALATYIPLYFKILVLSGNYTILTIFYVWGVLAGRRSGRTGVGRYKSPLFPLIPIIGIFIVIGEVVVLWLDPDEGRKSLFVSSGVAILSYLYYRFVLMRRPEGWVMTGPEDIDAKTQPRR